MKKRTDKYKVNKLTIFLIIIISIILLIGITFLWARFISTSGLKIKETRIINSKLPNSFNGFKIVHFSDVHYGKTIKKSDLENIVDKINFIKPDLVLFTGDLIDKDIEITSKTIKELSNILNKIDSKYGKYTIRGNHDYTSDSFIEIIENSNFKLLDNSYDLIYDLNNEYIYLGGLSSSIKTQINYQTALSYFNDKNNQDVFSIMLLHEPDTIDELLKYKNIDLVLAGHSHGGQVRLPWIGSIVKVNGAKKYFDDYYKISNTKLFISSGLGTSTYPIRLFNKPSINFYRLSNK